MLPTEKATRGEMGIARWQAGAIRSKVCLNFLKSRQARCANLGNVYGHL